MNKFSLIWSNLFRRKVRTFLTLFSVLVAFLLFALLRPVAGAFEVGIDFAGVDRLNVSPKYSIIDQMPITHLNEINRLEGVTSVTHQTWFGGTYQGLNNFFPIFPVALSPSILLPH
ncbi:MAG: ABC transporter permease, partial [Proteobacteria bacterium]|nr:ABC transporter permease [Pseudomonadota bacterium]